MISKWNATGEVKNDNKAGRPVVFDSNKKEEIEDMMEGTYRNSIRYLFDELSFEISEYKLR